MPLGLLIDRWDNQWLAPARELQCSSIHVNRRELDAARVMEIRAEGFQLYAWTVNRKSQALRLFEWGVDAIFTDCPDLLA